MRQAVWMVLLLSLCLAVPVTAQGPTPAARTPGRLRLTLQDATGGPVAGARARFLTEQQAVIATCTTGPTGHCTLELPQAPADAGGLIRGSLVIEGRGRRPLLWPGGELPLTVELDEAGRLAIPMDLYVTRTPPAAPGVPTVATPFPASGEIAVTPVPPAGPLSGTPGALPEATPCPAREEGSSDGRLIELLLVIFLGALMYGWWRARNEGR